MDEAHKTCQEKYISQWSLFLCYSKENSRNVQKMYTICYIYVFPFLLLLIYILGVKYSPDTSS